MIVVQAATHTLGPQELRNDERSSTALLFLQMILVKPGQANAKHLYPDEQHSDNLNRVVKKRRKENILLLLCRLQLRLEFEHEAGGRQQRVVFGISTFLYEEYKVFGIKINSVGGLARVDDRVKVNTQVKLAVKDWEEKLGAGGGASSVALKRSVLLIYFEDGHKKREGGGHIFMNGECALSHSTSPLLSPADQTTTSSSDASPLEPSPSLKLWPP